MDFTTFIFLCSTLISAYYFYSKLNNKKYPPGPRGIPFLGNVIQMGTRGHLVLMEWSKKYGSIISVKFGMDKAIVIHDPKLVKEIFNEPAFSGRPDGEIFLILSQGKYGVLNSEGSTWEAQRRFTLRHLRDFGFGKNQVMEALVMDEVKEVMDWLKSEEGKPVSLNRKFGLAVVNSLWMILSGHRYSHEDPKLKNMLDNSTRVFNEVTEKGLLVFTPWLKNIIPEYSGYNKMMVVVNEMLDFFRNTALEHKESLPESVPRDFLDAYLHEMKKTTDPSSSFYGEDGNRNLEAIISDLFQAGSETTSATLTWSILYLVANPEIQRKLQQEIDRVIGKSRVPCLQDRPQMVYTEALMMEVLRYSSIAPIGVFHKAIFDKEFHGYHIPKDTWIMANLYAIHHDPKIWGDPEIIRPERFLSQDMKSVTKNEALMPFSIGKRVCLGETLARDTFFLFLTSIFQRFTVEPHPAKSELSMEAEIGFLLEPKPFSVIMKDRIE